MMMMIRGKGVINHGHDFSDIQRSFGSWYHHDGFFMTFVSLLASFIEARKCSQEFQVVLSPTAQDIGRCFNVDKP